MIGTEHYDQTLTWTNLLQVQNLIFVVIFTIEMVLKLVGLGVSGYWSDSWNRFDGVVVVASWVAIIETSLWPFRLVRALRSVVPILSVLAS